MAFYLWEAAVETWRGIAGGSLSLGGMTVSAGGVIGAIIVLVLTRVVSRFAAVLAREVLLPRMEIRRGTAESAITLATYVLYVIGIVLASSALGLASTQITVVIGALGVEPPPKAHMIRFGESSIDFRLRCWVLMDQFVDVLGDLHVALERELHDAEIRIPFPQRDLHVYPGERAPEGPTLDLAAAEIPSTPEVSR